MRSIIAERLKTSGRIVAGGRGQMVSPGKAFRRKLEQEQSRRSRNRWRDLAMRDKERLKQLGGVARSAEEELEFQAIHKRNPDFAPISYFEKRVWERKALSGA